MKTIHKTNKRHSLSWFANAVTVLVLTAAVSLCLASCGGEETHKRFVVGVSQCSEDTWRDKLNEELRIAATYYDVDLQIKSANDDVRLQTEQINRFVEQGVDLLVVGKHGRSRIEEWLLGSVTRHVLSHAGCDVLVTGPRN